MSTGKKQEYEPPTLSVVGSVEELTQAFRTPDSDFGKAGSFASDEGLKENFAPVDVHEVLTDVAVLITR